jgi:Transposase
VLDTFQVTRLGFVAVDEVRRRVQQEFTFHRGRREDRLWRIRRVLRRGAEHLTDRAWDRPLAGLAAGDVDQQIAQAWIVAHDLRATPSSCATTRNTPGRDGETATFWITWYAQDNLQEIVFFDPPPLGKELATDHPTPRSSPCQRCTPHCPEVVGVNSAQRGRRRDQQRSLWAGLAGQGWHGRPQPRRIYRSARRTTRRPSRLDSRAR